QPGRVAIIGSQPLLEVTRIGDSTRALTLYGKPGSSYLLERATNVSANTLWRPDRRVPLTNLFQNIGGISSAEPRLFYRAREFFADPAILESKLGANQAFSLLL